MHVVLQWESLYSVISGRTGVRIPSRRAAGPARGAYCVL
ncbi:hypothetical protein BSLA_01f3380 [Burkholderia stabilis]|nr:hypothetical protein BSLA_01f3380 [Burkholderia stabilis]